MFTDAELKYLQAEQGKRPLARVATVGPDGTPHVAPVGMWSVVPEEGFVEVTGWDFDKTKKFRDVARTGRAAMVVDDYDPDAETWAPRGIEIRGRAEAVTEPNAAIRIYPQRIIGWGLDDPNSRNARSVG
jgi:pyridoxamine 5'-phosphate oxidase family protein